MSVRWAFNGCSRSVRNSFSAQSDVQWCSVVFKGAFEARLISVRWAFNGCSRSVRNSLFIQQCVRHCSKGVQGSFKSVRNSFLKGGASRQSFFRTSALTSATRRFAPTKTEQQKTLIRPSSSLQLSSRSRLYARRLAPPATLNPEPCSTGFSLSPNSR